MCQSTLQLSPPARYLCIPFGSRCRHLYTHADRLANFEYNVTDPRKAKPAEFDFIPPTPPPSGGTCSTLEIPSNGNFYSSLSPFTNWLVRVSPHRGVDYSNVTGIRMLMPKMYFRSTNIDPDTSLGKLPPQLAQHRNAPP